MKSWLQDNNNIEMMSKKGNAVHQIFAETTLRS